MMYTNCKITLYRLIDGRYQSHICEAFYNESKISSFQKTGLSNCDAVVIYIPHVGLDFSFTPGRDYVVKGECDFVLDDSTPQRLSQSMKELKEISYVTVMSADSKKYGSADMWHYQLSCR